jgi:hypothetical protein
MENEKKDLPHGSGALLSNMQSHIAMMAPHQKERKGGRLLIAAAKQIEIMQDALRQIATQFPCDSPEEPNTLARHKCEQARLALAVLRADS